MQSIIRIEHPESGKGLFSKINDRFMCDDVRLKELTYNHVNNFPTPRMDIGINRYINKDEFCAFKSIEQIQQWIKPNEFQVIIELGFKIYLLDVSECVIGEYQILYKKEHILQQKDISNLFITN